MLSLPRPSVSVSVVWCVSLAYAQAEIVMGVVRGNNLLRNQFLFCSFSSFAAQSYYNPISAFLTITLLSLNLALSLIVSSPSPPLYRTMRIPTHPVRSALAGPSRLPAASTNSLRRLKSTLPPSPVVDLPSSIEPQVTTLPNKIRVITEPAPGHINTVALTIDAGTRYESPRTSGVTHLLDKLAWQVGCRPIISVNFVPDLELISRAIPNTPPTKWR